MPRRKTEPALPARFHIKPNALAGSNAFILEFPFQEAIDEFVTGIKKILRVDKLEYYQYPSYRLLNRTINACTPTLVHAFEKMKWDKIKKYTVYQMLAVDTDQTHLPTEEQLTDVIRTWARYWAQNTNGIKDKINGEAQTLYQNFISKLQHPQTEWIEWNIGGLLDNLNQEYGLSYRAIPSLLAAKLHGKRSQVNNRTIIWRKAQDDKNGLFVVSQPFKSSYTDQYGNEREGFFAYKVEFQLHTQAAITQPWIHLFVRCQRYAHDPLKQKNYNRNISVLMGMNEARLKDWPVDSTLVQLNAQGKLEKGQWSDGLPDLLADLKARSLTPFTAITQTPGSYWDLASSVENKADEYYIVHAEGYKYGQGKSSRKHNVKSGFNLKERSEVVAQITHLLSDILEPDEPLNPDLVELPSGQKQPLATRDFEYFSRQPTIAKQQYEKLGLHTQEVRDRELNRRIKDKRLERQPIVAKAIKRSLNNTPTQIMILWRNSDTRDALYQQIREIFLLNEGDSFPSQIEIADWQLPPDLQDPLDAGILDPDTHWKPFNKRPKDFKTEWDKQMKQSHLKKMKAWRTFLQQLPPFKGYRLALIESLQLEQKKEFHTSQSIKGAIRHACSREGIASQLVGSAKFTTDKETGEISLRSESKGRIENAVCDLILRQTGILYGLPTEVYKVAGLKSEVADNLTILALCRVESTKLDFHYPLAIRLLANGRIEVLLPEKASQQMKTAKWIPYVEAGPIIGHIFAEARKDELIKGKRSNKSNIKFSQEQLAPFVEHVLTKRIEGPTLALLEADVWRNWKVWPQLSNNNMLVNKNTLTFKNGNTHKPTDLLGLRMVRIRYGDETPQYVVTDKANWDEIDESRDFGNLAGFIDKQATGLLHYFSIGKLPKTKKKDQDSKAGQTAYKTDTGGDIAFHHQQMLELVLFFEQEEDKTNEEKAVWCRIAHFLRSSPAWHSGNILLPYPLHLGKTLINDQTCILGNDD